MAEIKQMALECDLDFAEMKRVMGIALRDIKKEGGVC